MTSATADANDASSTTDVVLQRRISLPQSEKDVIVIQLNRPERLNCFNTTLCYRLAHVVRDLADQLQAAQNQHPPDTTTTNDVCAVILTSSGTSFCAGADLTDPPNPLEQSMDLPECLERNPAYQLGRIPVPVIGALKGYCITGGMELALSCDILVGDATVVFRDTHVKFGLAPCWGLSQRLAQRVGPGRAKFLSWTAQPIRAEQAYEWGLLDDLVVVEAKAKGEEENAASDEMSVVLQRALEIADIIGQNQSQMVQRYKRAMKASDDEFLSTLTRERALGLAHYLQVYGGSSNSGGSSPTFANAKDYITNRSNRSTPSKL